MKEGIKNKDRIAKRIRTKRLLIIAFLSLFLTPYSLIVSQNTVEQTQQFSYYWYAARQAIDQERYTDAYALIQFCLMIKPDDGQTLYYLGVIYAGLKQEDRAKEYFERAYEAMPKGTAPVDLLQRLKMQAITAEEWKKALALQDEIAKKDGYDAYSAITRYRIYALSNKPKKAIQEIDQYLETDPTNMRFLLFRLEIMEQMGAKPKELYELYERVLELDPYNLMILNNYAYHLATHGGDLTKAEKMSAITIREQPSNPTFLDTYGWILHLQGQDQLALFYLNKALWNIGDDEKMRDEVQKHIHSIK